MRLEKSNRSAVLLALASVMFWSGAATAFKKALDFATPLQLVFWGTLISTVVFTCVLLFQRTSVHKSDVVSGLYLGFLNPFLYYLILLHAYHGLPAQIAMVVNYLWPVVLVLLSVPVLGQRLNTKGFAGIVTSFAGVVLLAVLGRNTMEISTVHLIFAFASTLIWAVYWLLNTRNKGSATAVLFTSFVSGAVYLLVYSAVTGGTLAVRWQNLPWILYIGIFEMGFTYIMWNTALKWASSTAAVGSLIFITPFLALLLIGTVVGEKIALSTVGGLLLVVCGILLEKNSRRSLLQ